MQKPPSPPDAKIPDSLVRDEGYIKFQCHWKRSNHRDDIESQNSLKELILFRQKFYELGLIGAYPDGIGFGNISQILSNGEMLISGSATGNFSDASSEHFALVEKCLIESNEVFCSGPVIASSESMTHHMIYRLSPKIKVVVHVHHEALWEKYKFQIPTTGEQVPYGTPEMANEISRLFHEENLGQIKCLAMAGHEEGLIAFGSHFEEVLKLYKSMLSGL